MTSYNDIQKMLDELKIQTAISFTTPSQSELFVVPGEISSIQNQYDIVYNELKKIKADLQDKITIVDKTELIMNVLNYKIYEVRYNFRIKTDGLKEAKDNVIAASSDINESEMALRLVEIEKEINECEESYESQMRSIKEQKLEAQNQYENAINILDNILENVRKYYNMLLQLIQAEKEQLSDLQNEMAEIKYSIVIEGLQKDIDRFTELQTAGWRTKKHIEEMSVLLEERGLKFTHSGLLVTNSGHRITYEEAREQNLLDDMTFSVEFMDKAKDDTSTKEDSEYSRMSSEDVQYLKENLGIPLTLALAEITAVQPRDPIHYLGHWLFKYRYNQEVDEVQTIELQQINEERDKIARQKWKEFIEAEAKTAVLECIVRAEQESARREMMRIERELETNEEEEETWGVQFRDKIGD